MLRNIQRCGLEVSKTIILYINKCITHYLCKYKGLADERSILPRLCFTCETPIKFAFFCNKSFTQSSLAYNKAGEDEEDDKQTSICLIGEYCGIFLYKS